MAHALETPTIAVDVDPSACAMARRDTGIPVVCATADLPFSSATFSAVSALFVLHFEESWAVLQQAHRVLVPNGVMAGSYYGQRPDRLATEMIAAGFSDVSLSPVNGAPGHFIAAGRSHGDGQSRTSRTLGT